VPVLRNESARCRRSVPRRARGTRVALALGILWPSVAAAQAGLRPSDRPLEVPPSEGSEEPAPALPVIPAPGPGRLSSGLQLTVRRFVVEGSTVFSSEELEALTQPYTGHPIGSEDLHAARDAITHYYIDHGYVTSGATIPDQDPRDGVVRIRVEEGRLGAIELHGLETFREFYLRQRLERAGRAPVSVKRLEAQLLRLQQDPRIARIEAVLAPGAQRGESRLIVTLEENPRWAASARFSNGQTPSIGELAGWIGGEVGNLVGWSDVFRAWFQGTEGLLEGEGRYEIPVTPWDTRLGIAYRQSHADVVEDRFDALDIESRTRTARIDLSQPVLWTANRRVDLVLAGEYRESKSSVVGSAFCFQAGVLDCTPSLAILRFEADASWRSAADVVAARSVLSWGIDALGATHSNSDSVPDGQFVAWLGQAQWVHGLPPILLGSQVVTRLDVQLAADPLLSIEQIAVGGSHSVRGYRENQVVRDNGVVGSVEARIPVWREPLGRPQLEVVPFTDVGYAWDVESPTAAETLVSVGLGLRASPWRWLHGAIYWGVPLVHQDRGDSGLQQYGLYFEVGVDVP